MALTDNQALNSINTLVGKIEKSVRKGYTSLTGGNALVASNADPYMRSALTTCTRVAVTNTGAVALRVYENGILVCASLAQNATWLSPTSGAGVLKIDTAGAGTTFSLANYLLN